MDHDHLYEPVTKRARLAISEDRSSGKGAAPKACEFCAATTTPMWRRGPGGRGTLCNACGVRWSLKFRKGNKANKKDHSPPRWNRREQSPPADDFPGSTSSSADELSAPSSDDDGDDAPYESHRRQQRVSAFPGTPGQWNGKSQPNFQNAHNGGIPRHRQLSRLDDLAPVSSPGPSFRRLLSVVEEAAHEQQVAQLKREIAELKAQTSQLYSSMQQESAQSSGLLEKTLKLQASVLKVESTALEL